MKALIIIDMLNDFVTGDLKTDRAQRIIPNLRRLIDAFHKHKLPVIFSNDAHYETDYEMAKWGPHAMAGTKGAQVIPELAPAKDDIIIEKRTYGSFFETPLDSILRIHKVDTVINAGLHTHICVRHASAEAFFRGYKIIVPEDAVEAFNEEAHVSGLAYLKDVYDARIIDTSTLIKELP